MGLRNHYDATLLEQLKKEVHVWFSHPDEITSSDLLSYYQSLLSTDEINKYQRFISEKDRHDYLISHALVRKVLSRYIEIEPSEWSFRAGLHGRPEIDTTITDIPLQFNLTHTKGLCACVVTLDMPCGIDAEMIARNNNLKGIARRMFAPEEINALSALHDEAEFRKAFFKYWTLREAYVKATGRGLAGSSKDFYFLINDEIDIVYRQTFNRLQGAKHWQFKLFEATENHVLTIAINSMNHPSTSALPIICKTIEP